MMSYVLRTDDLYFITKQPTKEEGDWDWVDWDSRGVYMEGIRRLCREGIRAYSFVLPDKNEIVAARFMVSYTTEEECDKIDKLMIRAGLNTISYFDSMDMEGDVKTMIFYLLP